MAECLFWLTLRPHAKKSRPRLFRESRDGSCRDGGKVKLRAGCPDASPDATVWNDR